MARPDWQFQIDDDEEHEQQALFTAPKVKRIHDFLGIFPERVMPTRIYILERDGRLLIVRSMNYGSDIPKAQNRIWQMLVRLGELEDAPGSITVVCVWGEGIANRDTVIYDHTGMSDRKTQRPEAWRLWLRRWWEGTL